ncbi:MAG: hypothetical protein R2825_27790 [Saprospiraceae bacterium]
MSSTPDSTLNELLPSLPTGTHLRPDDFKAAPDLGGESDLMRIAQLLPKRPGVWCRCWFGGFTCGAATPTRTWYYWMSPRL